MFLSRCDLEKVERGEFEDVDDPGEGSLGAVGEQHDLQTTRHQGAVEDILLQQHLKHTHIYIYLRYKKRHVFMWQQTNETDLETSNFFLSFGRN